VLSTRSGPAAIIGAVSTIYAGPEPAPDVIHVGPSDARMAHSQKVQQLWRGPAQDPAWVRPSLLALVFGTAVLYLANLSASGYANSFYAAAVKAGSQSWQAMFYGSLDKSNFITVDKPPASLWVMDLSARVFGFSSWSLLAPQAVEGALSVLLLYLTVRRWAGPRAGLLAGLALALTPISALMFRFNNPDSLLVALMIGACYAIVRAVEAVSARWVFAAGVLIGFAFLTKMLQGLILLPALTFVYLLATNTSLGRRVGHVLIGGVGVVVGAGWWVAAVTLTPASHRPYIGGSQHNSVLELAFGYNGVGRLTGADNNGNVGGGGGFSSGQTGLTRLFGSEMGTQISWLLPAALILMVAGLWLTRRRPRTDRLRAGIVLWGGWLVVNGLVFSYASGIIHPYYTVALAPPIAALVGVGAALLWRTRRLLFSRAVLAVTLVVSAWWTVQLLGRASSWHPELPWVVFALTVIAVAGLFLPLGRIVPRRRIVTSRRAPRASVVVAGAAVLSLVLAPGAYAAQTAATTHSGALPTAGPSSARGPGGFGGARAGGFGRGTGGFGGRANGGGTGVAPGGVNGGPGTTDGGARTGPGATAPGGLAANGQGGGRGGFGGGALNGMAVDAAVKSALEANASRYTWAAAAVSSNEAGSLELGTNTAVMALGGFNGTDPAISLVAFQKLVTAGQVHYFYGGTNGSFIGSTQASTSEAYRIQQWVVAHYPATTVGTSTLYDLSATPTS
jgi:4-amino-4-deoxy-L-arabinose transferase-like glycosyltransferase